MAPIELKWELICRCPECGHVYDMVEVCESLGCPCETLREMHGTKVIAQCPVCEGEIEFITR